MVTQQGKVEQLISQLCPHGVEFNSLGEIVKIKNGRDWKHLSSGYIPVYGTGGVMGYVDTYSYRKPTVLIPRKGSITNIFYLDKPFWNVDTIYYTEIDTAQIIPRFFYYVIKNIDLEKLDTGSGRPSLTKTILDKIKIPLPPFAVQEEIVKILDTFKELEAELEGELESRKNQYQYYKEKLVKFENDVTIKTIGEICQINRGKVISKDYLRDNAGDYPVFSSQTTDDGIFGRISTYDYDGEYLTWTTDGANAGSIFYRNGKFNITNVCGLLRVRDVNVNIKFLLYALSNVSKKHVSAGMGNHKIMSNVMEKIKVPIPKLSEQERIVSILDKFDALVNDISIGLPAELKARRQQYEYYRNNLLTFKEYVQ